MTCGYRACQSRVCGSTVRPDGIELVYCVAHEAIARNLPLLRPAGCCASEGCGRPRGQRSPLCKSCRPRYSAWGLDGHLPAQEAPMTASETSPEVPHVAVVPTPPAAPEESSGEGAPSEPHPLETRRDALVVRLHIAGFTEGRRPAKNLRRFHHDPKVIVLIPDGHTCEVEGDFATLLDKAEEQCAKVEQAKAAPKPACAAIDGEPCVCFAREGDCPHMPGNVDYTAPPATVEEFLGDLESGDGEPSEGDVADAPLFVGGTDAAPAELVARWGQVHTAPVQPMPVDLDGLAAIAARGQQPTAPGPTVAELQQQLAAERARADLLDAEAVSQRQRAEAVEAELFELDHTLHTLGAHGTGSAKEWLLQVLTPEDRRAILEFDAAEARMDLARIRARARLNPAPPERVAEYEAKVATLDARIAALDAG